MKHRKKSTIVGRGGFTPWSAEEDEYLRKCYKGRGQAQIAEKLHRTTGAVRMRVILLGLAKPRRQWTAQEDEQLRQLHPTHSHQQIAEMFGCKVGVARYRMYKLGLRRFVWTAAEDRYIRRWAGKKQFVEIARILGKSPSTVRDRVQKLGIPYVQVSRRWQPEEDQYLREHYVQSPRLEITRRLQRSWVAVVLRARGLKLRRSFRRTARIPS